MCTYCRYSKIKCPFINSVIYCNIMCNIGCSISMSCLFVCLFTAHNLQLNPQSSHIKKDAEPTVGVSVWVCQCGCVNVGVSVSVSVWVCQCGCVSVGVSVWVCQCGCVNVGVSVWVCQCGYVNVDVLMRVGVTSLQPSWMLVEASRKQIRRVDPDSSKKSPR